MFAQQLLGAYIKYALNSGLECELLYESESSWSLHVRGDGCWELLGREAGKHVVQRIPASESNGRRHTSVVAVAVMPLQQSICTKLSPDEVEITTQRGHGKGGQHQNKVESAVRVVHRPSGITVFINGRDQYRNKQIALEILAARVAEKKRDDARFERDRLKLEQLGYGSRSGKLRTYNFIKSLVTDHRSGKKTQRIQEVMKGRLELIC